MASRTTLRRTTVIYSSRFLKPSTSVIINNHNFYNRSTDSNVVSPFGVRHYAGAGLKELKNRIATVSSIVKVTASMKMIANAKLAKQQERLRYNRTFYGSSSAFMDTLYPQLDKNDEFYQDKKAQQETDEVNKEVIISIASDRGLCGGVNSNIGREVARLLKIKPNASLVIIGDKTVQQIQREWASRFALVVSGVSGNKPITFHECLGIAEKILDIEGDKYTLVYSHFVNLVTFRVENYVLPNPHKVTDDERRAQPFQHSDENILKSSHSYTFASILYNALTESQTAEIAARMTAMDNATTNGKDLIKRLSLQYNKSRQTAITTELVEIVSGASAQDSAKKESEQEVY